MSYTGLKRKLQQADACLSDARDKQGLAFAAHQSHSNVLPVGTAAAGLCNRTQVGTRYMGVMLGFDYFISSQLSRFRAQQQLLDPNPANAVALAPSSSQSAVVFLQTNPKKEKEKKACRAGLLLSCFRCAALII
jgi:hypothetical protein